MDSNTRQKWSRIWRIIDNCSSVVLLVLFFIAAWMLWVAKEGESQQNNLVHELSSIIEKNYQRNGGELSSANGLSVESKRQVLYRYLRDSRDFVLKHVDSSQLEEVEQSVSNSREIVRQLDDNEVELMFLLIRQKATLEAEKMYEDAKSISEKIWKGETPVSSE